MKAAIERQALENRDGFGWPAGQEDEVLDHYRLAMSLAGIFDRGTPCFVPVPSGMQEQVYRAADYLRAPDDGGPRDGRGSDNIGRDVLRAVRSALWRPGLDADILAWQAADAQAIFATCRPTRRPGSLCRSTRSACSRRTRTHVSPTSTWNHRGQPGQRGARPRGPGQGAHRGRATADYRCRRAAVRVKLFDPRNVIGVFRGFSDSGMEFHADLVLPYGTSFSRSHARPVVLVQLEHEDEAVLADHLRRSRGQASLPNGRTTPSGPCAMTPDP